MARLQGVSKPPTLFARIVFWFVKRRLHGRVPTPIRIHALHANVFKGYAQMEMAQDKASRVPAVVKHLAVLRAATLIGCPF